MDVQIDELVTELVVEDQPTGLKGSDLKQIIEAVMQHVHAYHERERQREKDTGVRDRAYRQEGQ
jgi:hypothetical protein